MTYAQRKHAATILLLLLLSTLHFHGYSQKPAIVSLQGEWGFKIDSLDAGERDHWYAMPLQGETITLPGSMAGNLKGNDIKLNTQWTASIYDSSWYFDPRYAKYRKPGNIKVPFWLTPAKEYVGAAWYQRQVTIPASDAGKRIVLMLERAHTETKVWVDKQEVGMRNSLCVPHDYDLTDYITPGSHTITIRIDNRIKAINVGKDSHSLTDHTQGNWNGMIGAIDLTTTDKVWFDDIQVYPDIRSKHARVMMTIRNTTGRSVTGKIILNAVSNNTRKQHRPAPVTVDFTGDGNEIQAEATVVFGDGMLLWDEFTPVLYNLTAQLKTTNNEVHEKQVSFGMREFAINGTRFAVNGRPVFLRGTVENCVFPLTGYPPTDTASWGRVFRIAKAHGLNHMRFHSWCPPEAAFVAADKAGFYLQPEGPSWANHGTTIGDGKPIDQYIYDETNRISKEYGNHPSFCMLAYGNEPAGGKQAEYLGKFVNYWAARDKRRVYTGASVGMSWPWVPESQYIVKSGPRGLPWGKQPQTVFDHYAKIEAQKVPYVSHEVGQYCVFPDLKEISHYTGVYKAKNFELFREDLQDHHMGDQAQDFLMASGKLQALCYKGEIEAAFRTPGFAGFQLLGINDFPGQGSAIVGVLNAFWDEKGYITAKEFKRFCNSTVPLARIPKFVYTSNETFTASLELFHVRREPLTNAIVQWKITAQDGGVVASGNSKKKLIPIGSGFPLDSLHVPLNKITKATKLTLEVAVKGTQYINDWSFWVYPATLPAVDTSKIYTCHTLDKRAVEVLNNGGSVLIEAAGQVQRGKEVAMNFLPVFWNTSWFKMKPPHVTGILCQEKHPALAAFPTAYYSDLQWWELVNKQQVMLLDEFPPSFRPIVQPIDTWFLNRRLGLLLEVKAGKGKLIICSADLRDPDGSRPAARQLKYSILQYMNSAQFDPATTVDLAVIDHIFNDTENRQYNTYSKETPDELKPKKDP